MVGAVLVRGGKIVGRGWHRRAGEPHAEIEALRDAERRGFATRGATLYVTLEPCCTHGRTPPCTDAIVAAGIKRVVVGAIDSNPAHGGRGLKILRKAGLSMTQGVLAEEAAGLNEAFNQWVVHGTPFVTVKAAMTLDGKIATPSGESKWITGKASRRHAMKLRAGVDAILVGVNTILADDPSLTVRSARNSGRKTQSSKLRRIVLDTHARTPRASNVIRDASSHLTTIVVGNTAAAGCIATLRRYANVLVAPVQKGRIDLRWLLRRLGDEGVTSLLVEGGGEVNAAFLLSRLAHRIAFFYAPRILGGRSAHKAVAGEGISSVVKALRLREVEWRRMGPDLFLAARLS
jgi:diaminohydroxyphosphoribosylaminopyrimidine deaminase/5-amino-6-(5-phosphoribosylamino)uracil reductase